MSDDHVLIDVLIAAPKSQVWQALREPPLIRRWFGWDAETLEAEIDFIFIDNARETVPGQQLDFGEWEGVAHRFELAEEAQGTRLKVVATGKVAGADEFDEVEQGWITFVAQLRADIEHPQRGRRTIYLSGNGREGSGRLSEALHLDRLSHERAGSPYATRLVTGDAIGGVIWLRSHFQLALTIEQWGNGMLVVADRPDATQRPHGGGYLVATTHGLDDERFAALEARLTQWWANSYVAN